MGLFGAMTASVSGLGAQGQAISVISDNLSNTNTVGYKASRSLFKQLVTTSGVGGTSYNAGGTSATIGGNQRAQGSLNATSSVTDIAITGNGYFRVASSKALDNTTSFYYTRAGAFSEDKEGFLVNPDGFYLQGWRTDTNGNIANLQNLVNVELQSVGVSAQATKNLKLGVNLNSSTPTAGSGLYNTAGTFASSLDSILASNSADVFITDVRLFDAQGTPRDVSIAFSKRAANEWDFQVYTDGENIQGGATGTETRIGQGTLLFNPSGTLKHATGLTINPQWSGGVSASAITLDLGEYSGGQVATVGAGLGFTDHVLGVATEDNAIASGTYTIRRASATTMELVDGLGAVVDTATVGATGTREVYFSAAKVRMTVSDNFNETAGVYPSNVGTFTVAAVPQAGEGRANNGIIQFAAANNTSFVNQDGFASGVLSSIQIDEEGFVSGSFTNGETKKLFKLAIAMFQNPNGLEPVSGSLLRVTDFSGPALIKEAGSGSAGRIVSGALEGSTTDIANEFSQMIVAQRSFQASSKVITTVDQMLNELLQLR